ncbi:MAG: hypothetical protein LBQ84_00250 [Flavobacteriaceae bacterium]|jgi:hypothetical protein|nr:hypothetical protein [Flavobacteriaceae bacterium]
MNRFYLKKEQFTWKSFQTSEFIFYYLPGSKAEKNLALVEQKIARGITKAKEITKITTLKIPLYYFIVDDRKEFNTLTKLNHSAVSYSRSNTIIESYALLGEAHEVVHLITHQNWGNSRTWVMEGIAVYSDDSWNGKSLEKTCFELWQNKELIPLEKLLKNTKFSHFNSQISYPQSGLLVKYLIQTYGWDRFLKFWKKPDSEKIYALTIPELEGNWLEYVKKYNTPK